MTACIVHLAAALGRNSVLASVNEGLGERQGVELRGIVMKRCRDYVVRVIATKIAKNITRAYLQDVPNIEGMAVAPSSTST